MKLLCGKNVIRLQGHHQGPTRTNTLYKYNGPPTLHDTIWILIPVKHEGCYSHKATTVAKYKQFGWMKCPLIPVPPVLLVAVLKAPRVYRDYLTLSADHDLTSRIILMLNSEGDFKHPLQWTLVYPVWENLKKTSFQGATRHPISKVNPFTVWLKVCTYLNKSISTSEHYLIWQFDCWIIQPLQTVTALSVCFHQSATGWTEPTLRSKCGILF